MNGSPEHPGVEEGATEFLFDVDTYLAMADAGLLPERGVELIEGKIYRMAPIGTEHGRGQLRATRALENLILALGRRDDLGTLNATIVAEKRSAPDPDLMIVTLRNDYAYVQPSDAQLICEVAATSQRRDLGQKRGVYARANVPEYWVLDLKAKTLHVFRQPNEGDFAEHRELQAGDRVSPLFAEGRGEIAVAELF